MRLRIAIAGVWLAIAATTGCENPPGEPLRIGLLVWPAYELPYLARHLGYYDGLNLQFVEFHSPAEALHAYRSDGLDAVAVTVDYLIQLGSGDPSHRAIMVINVSNGADAVLVRPSIKTLPDLRGRRVGVERSALGAYMLRRMLDRAGMTRQDIEVVPVDLPDTPAAYRNGRVDAVVTYEPYRARILAAGAVELFSSRDIPGEIVDVLVTRADVIMSRHLQLQGLIDGWQRAVDYLEEHPHTAAEVLARRERLSPERYLQALENIDLAGRDDNRRMLGGPSPALREALKRTESVMREQSFIHEAIPVNPLIDARFFRPPDY